MAEDGVVSVTGSTVFDKEARDSYPLAVYARDDLDASDVLVLNVTVLDVNENPELSPAVLSVAEDRALGVQFATITASDPDVTPLKVCVLCCLCLLKLLVICVFVSLMMSMLVLFPLCIVFPHPNVALLFMFLSAAIFDAEGEA